MLLRRAVGAMGASRRRSPVLARDMSRRTRRPRDPKQYAAFQQQQQQVDPKSFVNVPAFIRARQFAKVLHVPVDQVVKQVATKKNRKFYMQFAKKTHEFKNIKEIILPYELARRVARNEGKHALFEELEPQFSSAMEADDAGNAETRAQRRCKRSPVIAVLGHFDHGKTTLIDQLSDSSIAKSEAQGITQKINVTQALLRPDLEATFLDTPGQFHFFRMRSSAAEVADVLLLVVSAEEGCLLQTEESIGCAEASDLPTLACINKIDIASANQIQQVMQELRSYVVMQECPIVPISASKALHLEELKDAICQVVDSKPVADALWVWRTAPVEGIVLEVVNQRGRGAVLRVLLKTGTLKQQDHFVAGMMHGTVRSIRNSFTGQTLDQAQAGNVVDIAYAIKSKSKDAPIQQGFFVVDDTRAKAIVEQRELAVEFRNSHIVKHEDDEEHPSSSEQQVEAEHNDHDHDHDHDHDDDDDDEQEEAFGSYIKPILVKADGAGSLTSILDSVDELGPVETVRFGLGNITTSDIDAASAAEKPYPIFGFNVQVNQREQRYAQLHRVPIVIKSTIPEIIDCIADFAQQNDEHAQAAGSRHSSQEMDH